MKFKKELIFDNIEICAVNGCWLWIGPTAKREGVVTGRLYPKYRPWTAQGYSYGCFVGNIPYNGVVHRNCNNALCVNPDHLVIYYKGESPILYRNYNVCIDAVSKVFNGYKENTDKELSKLLGLPVKTIELIANNKVWNSLIMYKHPLFKLKISPEYNRILQNLINKTGDY